MATKTSGNLQLNKPLYTESADIAVINGNMDTIDSAVTTNATNITKKTKPLEINCGTISSLPVTINNNKITSTMICRPFSYLAGTPAVMLSNWTVNTSTGSVTISGTISGNTTLKIWLEEPYT